MTAILTRLRPAKVTADEAVAAAKALCLREGVPWLEPVSVRRVWSDWVVWTHAGRKGGGNVELRVDIMSGVARRTWGPLSR